MSVSPLGFRSARRVPDQPAGELELRVGRRGGVTRPVTTSHRGVLRMMQPLYLDDSGQVAYMVMNPGGAYFGEQYRFNIETLPEASLLLTTQGATRIYKTPVEAAQQEMFFRLGACSRLEYLPDQTIAYRNAAFTQLTEIVTTTDAQGFFSDVVTPGWDPQGTRFTYTDLHLRLELREESTGGKVCVDNIRMRPHETGDMLTGVGYLEGGTHMATVLVTGSHVQGDYEQRVAEIVEQAPVGRIGVTSGTRHEVSWLVVRAIGKSTDELRELILDVNEYDRSLTTGQARLDVRRY